MEQATSAQVKCIKAMVNKLKVADADAQVLGFTNMRTSHVSEMSGYEASQMIRHLKSLDPAEVIADKMRKKIIAMAYNRAGLSRNASKEEKKEVLVHLEAWMLKYSYLKKRLDDYKPHELAKLVTQYESVLNSDLSKI